MTQESLKQLHHLATTDTTLTDAQRAELEDWYTQQDREEHAALSLSGVNTDLESLRTQVEAALAQLLAATKPMQDLMAENDGLRCDAAFLSHQVTTVSALQAT